MSDANSKALLNEALACYRHLKCFLSVRSLLDAFALRQMASIHKRNQLAGSCRILIECRTVVVMQV